MSDDHIPVEDFALVAESPPDDVRRVHLDTCTACRARWLDYQSFMSPPELPPEAHAEATRATMSAWIEREITREPAIAPVVVRTPRRSAWRGGLQWALAASAVVVVGLGLRWNSGRGHQAVVRGSAAPGHIELIGATAEPNGATRLSWHPLPGAAQYEVRLYRADLTEATRLAAGNDTTLVLGTPTRPDAPRGGRGVSWQVFAMRGGAPLGSSDIGELVIR